MNGSYFDDDNELTIKVSRLPGRVGRPSDLHISKHRFIVRPAPTTGAFGSSQGLSDMLLGTSFQLDVYTFN